jgi:tetratricopeptide (TPR) repeat protein
MTALGAEILWAETQRVRALTTENLSAYEAWLRANSHSTRNTRTDLAEARRLYQHAIELDPSFAAAYAGLGGTYNIEYGNGWNNRDLAAVDRAEELVQRALELDPLNPNGHTILAYVYFYRERPAEAVAAAERAIELDPNSEFAHAALGLTLAQAGRIVPALQSINRALRLNPRSSSNVLMTVAYVNLAAGRRKHAEELLERVRLSGPDNLIVRVALAAVYEYEGRHEEARVAVREALAVNPDLTAEIATRMIPGLEEVFPSEEAAQFEDNLRKAGLP